jgi:predicted DNA-binding transcriptional regulator AlpA
MKKNIKYIRLPVVRDLAGGVAPSTLWRWKRLGLFPQSYRIGPNICAWIEDEVLEWAKSRSDKTLEIKKDPQ